MRERIFAIVRKELSQLFRNRRTRIALFVPPIFQLIIFGYAVNLDVDNLRMAWMDMDQSPQSHDLLAHFQGSGRFLLTALPQNEREIQDVLDRAGMGTMSLKAPRITDSARVWFNPDLRSRNYFVPGVICNLIMVVTVMLTALAIVRKKEIGTMEQLMVTPIRPMELMIGKMIPAALVGMNP